MRQVQEDDQVSVEEKVEGYQKIFKISKSPPKNSITVLQDPEVQEIVEKEMLKMIEEEIVV